MGRLISQFLSHVLPGIIRPLHTLWNEVIGFLFIVFAVVAGFYVFRAVRNFEINCPIGFILTDGGPGNGQKRGRTSEMMICCKRQGRATKVDDRLKDLMKELGDAINESLSDSDRIAAAIGEIKRAGYDVFLVLEATIGFNKREDNEDDGVDEGETVELESAPESGRRRLSKIKLTSQDQKFLRALKISIDEEKH